MPHRTYEDSFSNGGHLISDITCIHNPSIPCPCCSDKFCVTCIYKHIKIHSQMMEQIGIGMKDYTKHPGQMPKIVSTPQHIPKTRA